MPPINRPPAGPLISTCVQSPISRKAASSSPRQAPYIANLRVFDLFIRLLSRSGVDVEIRMASALPVGDLSVRMRDDRHEPNGAAAPASACPEIATSIVIDAAIARVFIMAMFLAVSGVDNQWSVRAFRQNCLQEIAAFGSSLRRFDDRFAPLANRWSWSVGGRLHAAIPTALGIPAKRSFWCNPSTAR